MVFLLYLCKCSVVTFKRNKMFYKNADETQLVKLRCFAVLHIDIDPLMWWSGQVLTNSVMRGIYTSIYGTWWEWKLGSAHAPQLEIRIRRTWLHESQFYACCHWSTTLMQPQFLIKNSV